MTDPEMKAIPLNAMAAWAEAQGYCVALYGRQPTEEELSAAMKELAESRKRAREGLRWFCTGCGRYFGDPEWDGRTETILCAECRNDEEHSEPKVRP